MKKLEPWQVYFNNEDNTVYIILNEYDDCFISAEEEIYNLLLLDYLGDETVEVTTSNSENMPGELIYKGKDFLDAYNYFYKRRLLLVFIWKLTAIFDSKFLFDYISHKIQDWRTDIYHKLVNKLFCIRSVEH